MPFTFAHPAFILPLTGKKHKLSVTGLFIGSMVPDIEKFLVIKTHTKFAHTFEGMLCLNLPACYLIALLFHLLIKQALIKNLPAPFDHKFDRYKQFDFLTYLKNNHSIFLISSLIGIISHIVVDHFTHGYGIPVQLLPELFKMPIAGKFYLFNVLQYGLSLFGLLVIFHWILTKKNPFPIQLQVMWWEKVNYWAVFLLVQTVWICGIIMGKSAMMNVSSLFLAMFPAGALALFLNGILFNQTDRLNSIQKQDT